MQALWDEKLEAGEAEVHWSTGTILATFFAASLISAVFFGLGYSFGRGGDAKPSVGSLYSAASSSVVAMQQTASSSPISEQPEQRPTNAMTPATVHPENGTKPILAAPEHVSRMQVAHAAVSPAKINKATVTAAHAKASPAEVASGAAHYMVQVGAVGDHKDAKMLVSQLRKRGFHAEIYPSKHDKYLHVQIGPFASVEQAQTMRHHVMASGYHAILKHIS